MKLDYLENVIEQFKYYKLLADNTFSQLTDEQLFWQFNQESNSIAIIVNHLSGNMLSRWTDFLNSDGEKDWRNRDSEFENKIQNRKELIIKWNEGWECLINSLKSLSEEDLTKIIYIRNEGHTVIEAINRQLTHYPYHVGQIVYLGKILCGSKWKSLSIPKGKTKEYNKSKFDKPKKKRNFKAEFLNDNDE